MAEEFIPYREEGSDKPLAPESGKEKFVPVAPAEPEKYSADYFARIIEGIPNYVEPSLRQAPLPTVMDKAMDYLGIRTPSPRSTPLDIEAVIQHKRPFDIREEVFDTGRQEELRKVFQRGLATYSFGITDVISRMAKGEIEHPETTAGIVAGKIAELTGFIKGPLEAAGAITGSRLVPSLAGMGFLAQMMAKGAADLGISSGLGTILPALLEDESLADAGLRVLESTGVGALIGAIFPLSSVVPTKALRVATGLAVMDKIRSGTDEWFTIDDYVVGLKNGTIPKEELATRTYEYLLDLYFLSHVPSIKDAAKQYERVKVAKAVTGMSPEEVEMVIDELSSGGLIPRTPEREAVMGKEPTLPVDIAESQTFRGQRKTSSMGPDDGMLVAKVGNEEVGYLWYTKAEGGYRVNKVEVIPEYRRQGVATALDQKAQETLGKYLGPTTAMTPEGEAFRASREKGTQASQGGYDIRASFIDLPEMVEFAKDLMGGKYPEVRRKLSVKDAQGLFRPKGEGSIEILADLYKDTKQVLATLAHEIGHLVDYLPDRTLARGGLLGRIGSLKKYMEKFLEEYPGSPNKILTEADRIRLKGEARTELRAKEEPEHTIIEEVTREVPRYKETGITPEDILGIWQDVTARDKHPEIYEIVSRMDASQKKAIIKQALKGMVGEAFEGLVERKQVGVDVVTERVERTVGGHKYTEEEIYNRYSELLREEIVKRKLFEEEVIRDELVKLSYAWRPFNEAEVPPSYVRYRQKGTELYADAFSVLLNDPEMLRNRAPKFYEAFFNYLERKPDVKELYDHIQDDARSGVTLKDNRMKLRKSFRDNDRKYIDSLRDDPQLWDGLKRALIDHHNYILRKIKNVGEKNIPPGDNPRYKLEEMDHRVGQAEAYLRDFYAGVSRPLEKAGVMWDDFREYAFHKRVSEELVGKAAPKGWHKEASDKALAEMKNESPERFKAVEEAHKRFWSIRQQFFLDRVDDLHIFGEEFMEKAKDNEFYATWDVAKFFGEKHGDGVGAKIYKLYGTHQEILDPVAATVMKDISLMMSVSRIKAARSVINFLRTYYPSEITPAERKWVNKRWIINDPRGNEQTLIFDMVDGKANGYYVPKAVENSFQNNPEDLMVMARILGATAKPFRYLFTEINYGFWMFNLLRDYQRAAKNLPGANPANFAKFWVDGQRRAFRDTFKMPDDVVRQMQMGDMLISVADSRGLRDADTQMERLLVKFHAKPETWNANVIKPVGNFLNYVTNIGRVIYSAPERMTMLGRSFERGTKVAGYQYLKTKFPDMPDEVVGHMVRSWTGSPDFLAKGSLYGIYNNLLLFSNAIKEGYRGDYEAMSANPVEWWLKSTASNIAPKMLMYALASGIMGGGGLTDGMQKLYARISEYDMTNYICIPLGETKDGRTTYLRIPQDETGRLIGGTLWKLMTGRLSPIRGGLIDYMSGQAPTLNPFFDVLGSTMDYVGGGNPYDHFRGRLAISDLTFQAHDWRSHEAFLKFVANKSGAGIIHRFSADDDLRIKGELETILGYPIVDNMLGRFIKVSDYGEREKINEEVIQPIKTQRARELLDFREAIKAGVKGNIFTEAQSSAILREAIRDPATIPRFYISSLARRYGNVFLDTWLGATTKEEKMGVLQYLTRKQSGKPIETEEGR